MALVSPGVEVTIVDQSQYLPAPTNTVPLVIFATAENKANPTGTSVAQGTTAANAGKLFEVTSQRDLVALYGNPFFYTTTNGTPIQGYELNEYGLLAAYSALGITNRCYCLRADIDLASLVGQTGRPTGSPLNGTWWLDTTTSTWGIFEFNQTTGQFVSKTPIVITDSTQLVAGVPVASLGNIGDYAVDAVEIPSTLLPTVVSAGQFFYKNSDNAWVTLGTAAWMDSWPTVQATQSNPTLTPGNTFDVSLDGDFYATITIAASPNNTIAQVAADINALGWTYLSAEVIDGKLNLFSRQTGGDSSYPKSIVIANATGTVLSDIGMDGTYYQPEVFYGTSAQQPLWSSSQTQPRPTGSVWMKVGAAGNGLQPVMSQWNDTTKLWVPTNVSLANSDWAASAALDATGGQAIPAGSVYGQYDFYGAYAQSPLYLWERLASGPTVVPGNTNTPNFTSGPYTSTVQVSLPGSAVLSAPYTLTVPDNATATDFVTAWSAAGIPFTTAEVTTSGSIQLSHTEGGEIVINDFDPVTGVSNGLMAGAGFTVVGTVGCKYGPSPTFSFSPLQSASSGPGTGAQVEIQIAYGEYNVIPRSVVAAGSGYSVGDTVTVSGALLGGVTPGNDLVYRVTEVDISGGVVAATYVSGTAAGKFTLVLSNWSRFTYTANEGAPVAIPDNNTNWFYSVVDQVDIMVNYNGAWRGYKNLNYDASGFPTPTGTNQTDPQGPIISASEPTTQSDGTPLVYGDLWIDTSDLENYPVIFRWQQVNLVDRWVLIDNTDQVSATGVVFADARWATNGTTNPANDPIPTIVSLLTSDYLDLDAPEPELYPSGMMLFNTRRSGYNVKQFKVNYFNNASFPGQSLPAEKDAWVSASGLQSNGAPYMGRKAQRNMVVQSLRSAVDTNVAIRDEDNFFNLMAAPNYPELQPNMIVLNADRGETGYILGDTPMRLSDSATEIQAWATNAAGATSTGEDGLVTRNTYMGLFYPSGIAPDLSGNLVAVPASHMMLRTFLRNDNIAYPWLAAAGTRRGIIENATNIGYLDSNTGEFVTIKTRIGIRDVLYNNFINPLVFFTGNGLLNYGNKTSFNSQSALDRTNVARLVAYIRRQLTIAARPFVFEPNDAITRQEISGVVESLMVDLVAKRGIYDYLVVCDESNNTPARIDRNELWIDVAVEPVKAAEFIYIPVRILNTGELSQ